MKRTRYIKYLIGACAFMLIPLLIVNIQCTNRAKEKEAIPDQYASLDPKNSYIGMNACRECHQSIYDSYILTGMGQSMDVASRKKSSADFGNHPAVYDAHLDFYYTPFWDQDTLRILEYRLDGNDTIYKRTETVKYIVGSGQHTNSHIMSTLGYLNQMPLTFYTQKGKWDLPPGFENGGNSRFSRLIGLECITCHNSLPEFVPGSENRFDFVDSGINCERCHGPGAVHVADKRAGKIVDVVTGIDYSIVNPAKLPIDLQLDVCQRCHIQGNAVLEDGKSFLDFRPGMKLSDVMNVFMPVFRGGEHEHIMASHVERMKMSRCFTQSKLNAEKSPADKLRPYKDALTCVTCHNPHVSVKVTGTGLFNNACNNCHTGINKIVCTEKESKLKALNFNCVKCHMPASGATDIPHVSVHDHFIRKPVDETKIEKIKQFAGIVCINNPEPGNTSIGKAFIAYHEKFNFGKEVLDSAKKYFPSSTAKQVKEHFTPLVHIAFLETNYREVIKYVSTYPEIKSTLNKVTMTNDHAWTAYRIGESYRATGDIKSASEYFEIAYRLAPSIHDFTNKHATALVQLNKHEEAKKVLKRAIHDYPNYPPALTNLGYLMLLTEQDTASARKLYDRALALDPDYDQAVLNKSGLLVMLGKRQDAYQLLTRFLKRKPGHIQAQQLINNLPPG